MKFVKPIKISCKSREAWLEERNKLVLGGSDLTAVVGLDQYRSPLDVYRLKLGIDQRQADNVHTLSGRFLEDGVALYWEHESGHTIIKSSAGNDLYIHPKYKWLGGSPDRKFHWFGSKLKKDLAILEVKTTMKRIDVDELPKSWFIQPNFYTGLLGYKRFIIVWFEFFTKELKWQEFDFNQKLYDMVLEQAVDFYENNILKEVPPSPMTESDILKLYPKEEQGKVLVATEEQLDQYSTVISLRRQMSELKKQYDSATEVIKLQFEDAEKMVDSFDNTLFTYKADAKGSRRFLPREL